LPSARRISLSARSAETSAAAGNSRSSATGWASFARSSVTNLVSAPGRASASYDPKIALDPEVAYAIMSYGMRHGSFTGKRLSTFINRTQCDYTNARTIINGHNNAAMIADFAEQIELLLRVSCN
jgi:hypothetical protein